MMGTQIPACEHSTPRQRKGVPAEYAGLCDCCLGQHAAANGIWLIRGPAAQAEADLDLGI